MDNLILFTLFSSLLLSSCTNRISDEELEERIARAILKVEQSRSQKKSLDSEKTISKKSITSEKIEDNESEKDEDEFNSEKYKVISFDVKTNRFDSEDDYKPSKEEIDLMKKEEENLEEMNEWAERSNQQIMDDLLKKRDSGSISKKEEVYLKLHDKEILYRLSEHQGFIDEKEHIVQRLKSDPKFKSGEKVLYKVGEFIYYGTPPTQSEVQLIHDYVTN